MGQETSKYTSRVCGEKINFSETEMRYETEFTRNPTFLKPCTNETCPPPFIYATANNDTLPWCWSPSNSSHVSSSSKWASPPRPPPGKKACAKICPGPSKG